eukprot:CAMPEP_0116826950 /NCGR_PEP_ID=MMETSP0418-20121206/2819_1 /TAXON_ID=1158023 /ORGANISM="Astrosyne radiata, Strain 13vi08-1A" /LENGTH=215 /DNA_ID=CAMNT_0004455653 /DNA_START=99 /DNA_END=746 /DNA_ORIENTATION=+
MKYMVGLNATFGLASAFLNSYVNTEVVESKYVGILTGWLALVGAAMSLVLSKVANKSMAMILGCLCFFAIGSFFAMQPEPSAIGIVPILLVYTVHGIGRAPFESTLRATFADYFAQEKEGAFTNVIIQNGLCNAVGYILSFQSSCTHSSRYCVAYRDGSLHSMLEYELLLCFMAVFAVFGTLRAAALYRAEKEAAAVTLEELGMDLLENGHLQES